MGLWRIPSISDLGLTMYGFVARIGERNFKSRIAFWGLIPTTWSGEVYRAWPWRPFKYVETFEYEQSFIFKREINKKTRLTFTVRSWNELSYSEKQSMVSPRFHPELKNWSWSRLWR